ncbi:hypothetical protein CLV51_103557 [Chitinophaga niastensis]|uniref:Lipoprotein n=1 Tax=Chitinophaga niastensis TaxID=536980 RepID=A0A2P8HK29_CHINA|nr:hypothetical protein [Chitinophaga niastensis]PSL46576.1 hypothetical protein CLV51_103557 [Chitinophaga niastensis]
MKKILFLSLVAGLLYACKKDNIGTKPILTFSRYSQPSLDSGTQQFDVVFNVRDGDGDIENVIAWKIHYIQTPPTPPADTFTYSTMPNIGQNKGNSVKAEVSINMQTISFNLWNPDKGAKPDSLWYTAFILDNAGHSSDTIVTPKIPIFKSKS